MSKNPQVTIALAFVLTFLLGASTGYLLCVTMHPYTDGPQVSAAEDVTGADRIAPVPAPAPVDADAAPDTDANGEPIAPVRERRAQDEATRSGDRAGLAAGERPGTGQGYRDAAESATHMPDRGTVVTEARESEGLVSQQVEEADAEPADRPDERRSRSQDERSQDEPEMREGEEEQEPRRRLWRSRTDNQQSAYSRFRLRLVSDLELSEEVAESFFSVLESHRQLVREEVIIPQRELRQRHSELSEKLDAELSGLLSEEQMEIWRERYAPRLDRSSRGDTDRQSRRDRGSAVEDSDENTD